jgi:Tfp pilus assembly protein PilO
METKTIVQYVVAGVVVAGSLFVAYNAQDKITDQATEIKVLQNQVAALNEKVTENEALTNKNKALEAEVKNLEAKLATKTKAPAPTKANKASAKPKVAKNKKAHKASKKK